MLKSDTEGSHQKHRYSSGFMRDIEGTHQQTVYVEQKSIARPWRQTPGMKFPSNCALYKSTRTLSSCVTVREKNRLRAIRIVLGKVGRRSPPTLMGSGTPSMTRKCPKSYLPTIETLSRNWTFLIPQTGCKKLTVSDKFGGLSSDWRPIPGARNGLLR